MMTVSAQRAKTWAARLLLAFVLVSIGFALGKETTLRAQRRVTTAATPAPPTAAKPQLVVYFIHGTIRCVTCTSIERQARQTLEKDFASELASGRIVMKESNFDEDPSLANRYNVSTSTVVLVRRNNDNEVRFKRLDDVWIMIEKSPAEFADFIHSEIAEQLARGNG